MKNNELFKDDFVEWLAFTWHMYTCDSRTGLRLEYNANKIYRVSNGIDTLYEGNDLERAVKLYNKLI